MLPQELRGRGTGNEESLQKLMKIIRIIIININKNFSPRRSG